MNSIPSGIVTFLFTDIEGSTKLAQEFPDTLPIALEKHHLILRSAIESSNGFVFEIVGDAFCCAFENADDAVKAAVMAQKNLSLEKWNDAVIKVRIGIHSGNAEWNGKRYMGYITLARTARVMSAAYGEQIIVSTDAYEYIKEKIKQTNSNIHTEGNEEISFRDLGERRLKDVIQPIRLYQVLSRGLREDFPPLKTLDARPNNLPVQLTSFIGRENEMSQLKDLLRQTPMLTLTGSGGSGKTRLAMQVGADVIDEFANGVFMTELAFISDPTLIVQAIMDSLGLKEEPGLSREETLTSYLKNKEMLLILDNAEHLINECASLTEMLLGNCPKLKIISTSREAFNCQGEQTFRVPSLSLPDTSEINTPEQLSQYESVRLFIERALSVNQNFKVTNDNAPALAEICHRLDGIPLALELAAARTKILTLEKISERLDDRFALLTGGRRTSLPRQQTLRALIDWSYDLLSEKEKLLWRRLSLFNGGWTIESAEAICSDDKINKIEVLEILNNLSEKSIIIYEEERERFKMLETIRQYGIEKLKAANENEKVSDNHLKYYLKFAETAESFLGGSEMQIWLGKLEMEKGNMETALTWAAKNPQTKEGLMLASSLASFWNIRGKYSEGRRWLENFISNRTENKSLLLGKALSSLGRLAQLQGEKEIALKNINESVAIMRELKDRKGISNTLSNLGLFYFEQGKYEKAQECYEESLNIFREIADKHGIALSLNHLGILLLETGEYERASKLFSESVEIHRETGDKRGLAYTLGNLANIALDQGDPELGVEIYHECLDIFKELEDKRGIAFSLCSIGNASFNLGKFESASKALDESIIIFRKIGEKRGAAFSLCSLATVALHEGDYEKASSLLEESLIINRETENKSLTAFGLFNYGTAKLVQGETAEAEKLFQESLEISKELGHKPGIAYNMNSLGIIAYSKGDFDHSYNFFKKSMELNKELNQKKELIHNVLGFSEIKYARNEPEQSALLLGFFKGFFDSMKFVLEGIDSKRYETLIIKLKEALNKNDFSKYFDEGRKLTLDQAVDLIFK